MTRRRRSDLASRVCIGMFLLLFANAAADSTKGPPTILEKIYPPTEELYEGDREILGKVSSEHQSEEVLKNNESLGETSVNLTREETSSSSLKTNEEDVRSKESHQKGSSTLLSDVNDVTVATTVKSAFIDSSKEKKGLQAKSDDEKRNKTTAKLEDKREEKRSKITDLPGLESDRESTTISDVLRGDSEAADLEKFHEEKDEGKAHNRTQSYDFYYKTFLSPFYPNSAGNGTNLIHEGSVTQTDPKEEIEIIGNMTHTVRKPIPLGTTVAEERIETFNSTTAPINTTHPEMERNSGNRQINGTSETKPPNLHVVESTQREKLERSIETTTIRIPENTAEQTSPINPSPVPRARTITFSGVNEFSVETKTTTSKEIEGSYEKTLDAPFSKKNTSTEKSLDQKPYPYLKSTKEPTESISKSQESQRKIETTESLKVLHQTVETTEETSAYENTIERGRSENKFVVTEPSVVIENSIQQFKQDLNKNGNESVNSTTEASPLITRSSSVNPEVEPTNETFVERSFTDTGIKSSQSKSSPDDNDVPEGKDDSRVINKDENFDVTGNGITEVSPRIEGSKEKTIYESSLLSNVTEIPLASNASTRITDSVDVRTHVQTDAEESLLMRSTLNVTEASTEFPLSRERDKLDESTAVSSAISISTAVTFTENSTVIPAENVTAFFTAVSNTTEESFVRKTDVLSTVVSNGTNEITIVTTLTPEETSLPTTSIEYEFVGLTETVTGNQTTEKTSEIPEEAGTEKITTIQEPSGDYSSEVSTSSEDVTESSTTIVEETTLEERMSTTLANEQTTTSEVLENETTEAGDFREEKTVDYTEDVMSVTKDSQDVRNTTTEISFQANTTSTSKPFIASTIGPRVIASTWSTLTTSEATQTLPPEEITLLVRIVIEGSSQEVCPQLQTLRKSLADILTMGMNKPVLLKQVMFHQSPCQDQPVAASQTTDSPLTSILVYVVDENGKLDTAMTKILPSLYKVSSVKLPVTIHSFLLVQETDSGNAIAVVVVSSVAFICLVLLAGLLFIMRKRQTRFNYGERCRPVSLDAYSLDSVSAYNSVRRKGAARSSKRSYGNPTFEDSSAIPSHPLNFAGLSSFCNDVNAINEEFSSIPQVSAKIDELPPGAEVKNRYANVIPLPETRVPLQRLNNDPLTEYINASYVRGPKNAMKYYVACQAPIESTVTDFWRMIWEQQSKVIIMLTDLVENGVEKCIEYIPPSEVTDCHRLYGDFQVTLKKRETKEKYAISTLHLKNLENNTFREVFHIWYLWPVNGVQSDGAGLIAVLLEARALQRGGPGPIVVHCSSGTGRTGTLIALDLGIRQYEITRTVDVPRVVYTIRRDRAGAVQTKGQYAFIYKALNLYATKLAGGVLEST